MRCRYCHKTRPAGYSITCGGSRCQQQDATDSRERNRPRRRGARRALAVLVLLLAAGSASAADVTPDPKRERFAKTIAVYLGAGALDLVSTEVAFVTAGDRVREANGLMARRGVRITGKVAAGALFAWADRWFRERGEVTRARVVRVVWIVYNVGVSGWNLVQAAR